MPPIKLSIISPTFNESENLSSLVAEITSAVGGMEHEIIIVDDDSPDLTWQKAQEIGLTNKRVQGLRRLSHPGLGNSVIDGFRAATGEMVACIDADLQHDPKILREMVQVLDQGAEIVIGSRYVENGSVANWNLIRQIESWIATKLAQIATGITVKDPMSGYFMMRRKDFLQVAETLDGKGFKILLEIISTAKPRVVKEVPFTFGTRQFGESKLTRKVIFLYLQQLWRLVRKNR